MSDMKILGHVWYAGNIGIVLARNDEGQVKAYIKTVPGDDERLDIQSVLMYGNTFPTKEAVTLIFKDGTIDVDFAEFTGYVNIEGIVPKTKDYSFIKEGAEIYVSVARDDQRYMKVKILEVMEDQKRARCQAFDNKDIEGAASFFRFFETEEDANNAGCIKKTEYL